MKQLDLTLLYLIKDDQVLLAMKKRGFGEGKWNGVGGKIESGESITDSLERECQEEIGVTPTNYKKVGELCFNEHHNGERKIMNLFVFTADDWTGHIAESEEMKPKWYKKTNIPLNDMWPADQHWLPEVLTGKLIVGNFILAEDESIKFMNIKQVSILK